MAWTRSALNLAANGVLLARAAIAADLVALGVVVSVAIAPAALLMWRHGNVIYPARRASPPGVHHQRRALLTVTALTVATAVVAVAVALLD
jgi:hypothetical protein